MLSAMDTKLIAFPVVLLLAFAILSTQPFKTSTSISRDQESALNDARAYLQKLESRNIDDVCSYTGTTAIRNLNEQISLPNNSQCFMDMKLQILKKEASILREAKTLKDKHFALCALDILTHDDGGCETPEVRKAFASSDKYLAEAGARLMRATPANRECLTKSLLKLGEDEHVDCAIVDKFYRIHTQKDLPWGNRPSAEVIAFVRKVTSRPTVDLSLRAKKLFFDVNSTRKVSK